MSLREGRDRTRRDHPSRSELKPHHRRGSIPPSRHLWAGNLSLSITESVLARHFLQFGDLESIAYQPGRTYAFVNYLNEEDAFAAVKELQGIVIGGNPLRIEFAKPEKSPHDADYAERRDEPYHISRESPFSHRDSRARYSSPEPLHLNRSNMNDKDGEPSEVLWVGFPAQLKMDEFILRKAFSPFGEIDKITAFPGRTYAFIRFRNVMAACRAKEALHGKLFGNPRVHITFAKNDSGKPNRERISANSPHEESYGSYRNFGDHGIRSPPPFMDPGEADAFEQRRFRGHENNIYEQPLDNSPRRNVGARIREFSPHKFPRRGPIYDDDPWDLPEDVSLFHGAKKLKTNNNTSPDNELPEYPFSDLEKAKRILPQKYDSVHSGYRSIQFGERGDHHQTAYDDFNSMPSLDRRRLTPERRQFPSKQVWKWEGMIAKGGTSVCRARCFPVGKPPEMVLPGFLDCTARTSLDMLAKHYYQAAAAWVVFFAPANDPDISYYNEFMNYLGEKQRAAVVKLDEIATLFLVPPSEFSEKVLKVPGRLSISGVILRLETPPGSSYIRPTPQDSNRETTQFASFHGMNVASQNSSSSYVQKAGSNWVHQDFQNSNPSQDTYASGGNGKSPIVQETLQLTSSLLRQQGQSSTGEYKVDQSGYPVQNYGLLGNEEVCGEFGQMQQQQVQDPGQSEGEGDPQKRLKATLQLAAALLQQIQQGKGT